MPAFDCVATASSLPRTSWLPATVFSVADDGTLTYAGYQATGSHPRNFNITPNGRWLLVACRDTDAIEIYALDPATGLLSDTSRRIPVQRPVFVGW